jgi:hypothetical protein
MIAANIFGYYWIDGKKNPADIFLSIGVIHRYGMY